MSAERIEEIDAILADAEAAGVPAERIAELEAEKAELEAPSEEPTGLQKVAGVRIESKLNEAETSPPKEDKRPAARKKATRKKVGAGRKVAGVTLGELADIANHKTSTPKNDKQAGKPVEVEDKKVGAGKKVAGINL